jgi:hypothetical protein
MASRDATERKLIAERAIAARWARSTPEQRRAQMEKLNSAFMSRFEREVDPEGKLDPAERAFRAKHAAKAYFAGLALSALKARRKRAGK